MAKIYKLRRESGQKIEHDHSDAERYEFFSLSNRYENSFAQQMLVLARSAIWPKKTAKTRNMARDALHGQQNSKLGGSSLLCVAFIYLCCVHICAHSCFFLFCRLLPERSCKK